MRPDHVNVRVEILDPSGPGDARRQAVALAQLHGADEETIGKVALVTTELAQNLVKHTSGGEILLRATQDGCMEILSLDRGPGMESPEHALQDGYSTAGTRGTGLGGVVRTATAFDLYSGPSLGTAIWASLHLGGPQGPGCDGLGAICRPFPGEEASGDGWASARLPDGSLRLLLVDGLGHGAPAAEATHAALETFSEHAQEPSTWLVERIHRALRATRGAAVGLATVPPRPGQLTFTGVGNIAGAILAPDEPDRGRGLASYNGTAGYLAPRVATLAYDWPSGGLLILHTDGLLSRHPLAGYPGLVRRQPALIAGVLYRDFARGRDDIGVLVSRTPTPRDRALDEVGP